MRRALELTRTLVGQKVVMAVSGAVLMAWLVAHMLGNLKVFQGPEKFNHYAEFLRTVGAPLIPAGGLLWGIRVVLVVCLIAHIWAATRVTLASWRARPQGYRALDLQETTYAARTMRWGGVIVLLYIVYHLLDFTFGAVNPGFEPGNVYRNVVASFSVVPISAVYLVANVLVGLHVYHGLWSAAQTLGLNRAPTTGWRRGAAQVFAGALTLGFVSVPLAVLAGVLR